ncbi:nicotinamidase-related amidase [Loktanella sp. PT4BL]|jgi:nicotinamidase-related amidase|uniref:Maleamate amidohydrolase n=1 Tax=Yoonia vestfoldensis TaxID=245188 RepID=A0A1Y0EGT8_9RHOB|nr:MULTISPECIES: isochorismatase family protein [Rhodobacterales]ARU02512.1 maleamate amidohydrolase [Yoonia vestfoldensis]PXW66304.1 nicotinamidase-related amidase [Loktanella sp. PT4BL]
MSQKKVYEDAGFGVRVQRGSKPALVVIDFSYGFTDPRYPTASDADAQIVVTNSLIAVAREKSVPVIFSVIAFNTAEVDTLAWLRKAQGMKALVEGSHLVEIDARLHRLPDDAVVVKKGASAFFGTNLAAHLAGVGIDTTILTGATTSGCVRASAVDAVQSGFNVLVVADACADRAAPPHEAALYDIDQKYGDVIQSADVLSYLNGL